MTDYVYKDYVFNDKTGQFEQVTFDKKRKLITQPKPVEKIEDEKPKKTTGYDRAVGNVDTKNEIVNKGRNFVNSTGASVAGNTLMLWDTLEQNFKDYLATLDPGKNLNKDQYMKDYQNLYLKQNDLGSMNPINFPSMSQPKQVGSSSVEVIKDIANPGIYKMNVSDPNKDKKEAVSKAKNKLVKSEIHNPVNLEGKLSGDLKKYAAKEREKSMEGIDNGFIKGAMDLGYTMAEMAPAAALSVINPFLGSAYLGANAAGNQMYDVTQRGGKANDAFASGIVTGGIELATEALPLKMFADTLKTGGKLTSNVARQALTEGAEEGLSYILGNTAEKNMLGDLANPFSNDELFESIVMGGLSGGILGGAGTAVGNYKQNKLLKSEAKTDLQLQSQIQQAEAYEKNAFDDKEAEQLRTFKDTKQLELDESLKAKDEELSRYVASKVDMYEMLKLSEQDIQSNLKRDVNAYKRAQGNFRSQAMISSNPLVQMEAQRENAESISSSGKRYKVTEDNIKAIQDVSSKIGVSVRFEDSKKMPYGSEGYYRNGEIVISNETKNPVLQVFGHEVTHYAEDSDFYNDYVNVATHLITKQGRNFEAVKQEFVAQYAERGVQLTEEDATHEVLAHFTQELITNEKELNDLVRTDMNVAQKILNWIKSQLSRFGKDADLIYARDVLSKAIANPNLMDKGKEQYLIDKNGNEIILSSRDIKKNQDTVRNMNPVYSVGNVKDYSNETTTQLRNRLIDIFNHQGNKVENPIFGDIILNNSSAKNDIGHRNYNLKNNTYEAIIPTLKYGLIINVDQKDNARLVESAQIAAPISIPENSNEFGKTRAYLVARIKQDENSNRFYLHDISLTDEIKKDSDVSQTGSSLLKITGGVAQTKQVSSTTSISNQNINQNDKKVNGLRLDGSKKDLQALHNLNADKLMKSSKLGGLVMPSIAITKDSLNHEDFGDITLAFNKETIDPKNKENKVYSKDAWSPMFPDVDVYFDTNTLVNKLSGLTNDKQGISRFVERFSNYEYGITENQLDTIYEGSKSNEMLQDAYKNSNSTESFELWFRNLVESVELNRGIYNGKDPITNNGRRTFKQLHNSNNAEEILAQMKKQKKTAQNTVFASSGSAASKFAKEFKSIDQIIKNESLLEDVTENDFSEIANNELYKLTQKLVNPNANNMFTETERIAGLIHDLAQDKLTINDVKSYMNEYGVFPTDGQSRQILDYYELLKTKKNKYFEAKPRRIVGMNEINTAVIPNTLTDDVKKHLKDAGVNFVEYDPKVEGDRNAKVKSLDDIKFSLGGNLKNQSNRDTKGNYFVKDSLGKETYVYKTPSSLFLDAEGNKIPVEDHRKVVRRYLLDNYRGKLINIGDLYDAKFSKRSAQELSYKYSGDRLNREIKHELSTDVEPILKDAVFIENIDDYGHHPEAVDGWDYFKVKFGIDNQNSVEFYTGKLSVMITRDGPIIYDVNEIKRDTTSGHDSIESTSASDDISKDSIDEIVNGVNNNDSKYSLGLSLDKVDNSIKVNNHIERGMKEMVGDYFYNPLTKDDVREALKIGTREILDEGEILENTKTTLFNRLVDSMVNKDRSIADEYKDLILDLQNTVFKIDDKTKHNITNFQDIKKTAGLRSNLIDGIEIDSKYDALNNSYPYLFPKEIINVYDRFTKIAEVKMGLSIKYTPLKKEAYFDKQFESILKKEFEDFITSYTAKVLYSNNPKKYESYMKRVKKMILGNETVENIMAYSEMLKDGEDYGIIEIDNSQFDASKIAASVSNRGSSNKPLNIVLDENSGINEEMREELADAFERPLNKAKGKMTENVKKNLSILKGLSKNFGIKVGSLESEALQRYVSKKKLTGNGIETVEYTITDLQSDLPNTWRNVVSAAKVLKPMIDEYVVRINSELEIIYPGVQEKADAKLDRLSEDINFINTKLDKTKKIDLGSLDKDAKTATIKAIEKIKINLSSKITEYNNLSKDIDSGEIYRNKRLMPKNDYFHHIRETNADDRLSEIFSRNNGVSNQLASISEFTKPNAIWSSLLQKQTGGKYKEDAMASMLDYVRKAEYKIAIDPLIAEFRGKIKNIVEASNNLEVNNNDFIQYLSNFVNDLAGKTNPIDRSLGGQSSRGRAGLKVAKKINNVLKRSMVFGSFKSAISQFFNLPNSMAILSMNDPKHFVKDTIEGINKYSKYVKTGEGTIHDSIFINERYLDNEYNYFDEGIWKHPRKLGNFTMEFGDRVIAEITWFSAYEQGKSLGKENLIEYADDITKRAVGGRGIGEIPLMQKSELIKLVAPFQLEVNNQFILQNKLIKGSLSGDKEKMLGFLMMVITGTLINAVRKEIDGSTTAPDYIGAFLEGYEDSEDEDRIDDKIFKIGKRLGGEYLSNMPMGSQISQVLFPSDIERKQWFGESDPTRYGTGLIPIDYVVDPIKDFIDGKNIDPKKIISPWLPVGGKQVERTLNFLEDSDILPDINFNRKDGLVIDDKPGARNQSGEIKFNIDKDPLNIFKGFFFGTSSTKNAIEYYENDWKPLNENRTSAVDQLHYGGVDFGESYEAMRHTAGIEGIKGLTNSQGILARDYLEDINMWDQMKYDEFIADQFGVNKTVRTMPDSEFEYKLNNGFGSALDVDKSQKMDSYMKKYNLSNNDIYGAYERTSEIESIKDVNGKSINLSQDAQQRKILQDFGIWEQVGKDLEFSKLYGIETTVFNWTQEEFDEFYKSLIK